MWRQLFCAVGVAAVALAQRPPPAPTVQLTNGSITIGTFTGMSMLEDGGNLLVPAEAGVSYMALLQRNATAWSALTLSATSSSEMINVIYVDPATNMTYFGGIFVNFGGVVCNNIARFDGANVYPLQLGLNGPVQSIVVINGIVFASGLFTGPSGNKDVYHAYGLVGVAAFVNNDWQPLDRSGLLPQSLTKLKNINGQLWAYGDFPTTGDGTAARPADQLLTASVAGLSATSNSSSQGLLNVINNAQPQDGPSNCWIMPDGTTTGSLTVNLGYGTTVHRIRLANTRYLDRGTRTFQLNSGLALMYNNTITRTLVQCTTACPLPRDTSLPWVDFYLVTPTAMQSVVIQVNSAFGAAGGLCGIQVYRSEYMATVGYSAQGTSIKVAGTWVTNLPYYQTAFDGTQSFTASFTNVDAGHYDVHVTTGSFCFTTCVNSIVVAYAGSSATVPFNPISTDNVVNSSVPLQGSFSIRFTLLGNTGDIFSLTGVYLQRVVSTTFTNAPSAIYTINADNTTTLTSAAALPYKSSGTIYIVTQETSGTLIVGGDLYDIGYVGRYWFANNSLVPLNNGGVNYLVASCAILPDGTGFVIGGSFSATFDGTVVLNNVALYINDTWTKLGEGVDSDVTAVAVIADGVYVIGDFSLVYNTEDDFGLTVNGYAVFNLTTWMWSGTSGYIDQTPSSLYANYSQLLIGATFSSTSNRAGNYVAQWLQPQGQWRTLSNTGFNPNVQSTCYPFAPGSSFGAYTAVQWKQQLYVGGSFRCQGTMENYVGNIAVYNESTDSFNGLQGGVGLNDNTARVNALAVYNDNLWVGGAFTSAYNTANDAHPVAAKSLAIWNGTIWINAGLPALEGSFAVNALLSPPGWSRNIIVVGGLFETAGKVLCRNICIWDGSMWSALGMGLDSQVNVMATIDNFLVVGGTFTYAGSILVNNIALWDFDKGIWLPLNRGPFDPVGLNDEVTALAIDGSINSLFIGGTFDDGLSPIINAELAKYDGQRIHYFGNLSDNSNVNGLRIMPASNTVANNWLSGGNVLMVYGQLILSGPSTVVYSSLMFDGYNWRPYQSASQAGGSGALAFVDGPPTTGLPAWAIAIAVVFSILGAILLVLLAIFLWRRFGRKSKQPKTGRKALSTASDRSSAPGPLLLATNDNRSSAKPSGEFIPLAAAGTAGAMAGGAAAAGASTALPDYKATQDFTAEEAGELSLLAGDLIVVIDSSNNDWWHGEVRGRRGWFPKSFVEPIMDEKHASQFSNATSATYANAEPRRSETSTLAASMAGDRPPSTLPPTGPPPGAQSSWPLPSADRPASVAMYSNPPPINPSSRPGSVAPRPPPPVGSRPTSAVPQAPINNPAAVRPTSAMPQPGEFRPASTMNGFSEAW